MEYANCDFARHRRSKHHGITDVIFIFLIFKKVNDRCTKCQIYANVALNVGIRYSLSHTEYGTVHYKASRYKVLNAYYDM